MTRIARPDSSGGCPSSESADYCAKGAPVRSWAAPSARNVHGPYSGHFICPRSGVRPENPTFMGARANARAAAFRLPEPGSRIKNHAVPASSSVYAGADGFPHGRLDQVFDAAVKAAYVADHISSPRAMSSNTALSSRLAPIPANASAMRSFI